MTGERARSRQSGPSRRRCRSSAGPSSAIMRAAISVAGDGTPCATAALRLSCAGALRAADRSGARRSAFAVVAVACAGLWWRLVAADRSSSIVATPWLKAAIEENFGGNHTVTVGGTQIERDENGPHVAALARHRRARRRRHHRRQRAESRSWFFRHEPADAARCARKASIWSAPKWRCGSKPTAGSLSLPAPTSGRSPPHRPHSCRRTVQATADGRRLRKVRCVADCEDIAGILAWIDGLGATGLDGHDLRELGLKNGNLIVDDRRNGKRWTFDRINASLTRPARAA